MNNIELTIKEHEFVIDSRLVSVGLGIEHESLMRGIYKYESHLEELGLLRFQIGKPNGGRPIKFCWLNGTQVNLIAALSKNTDQVVAYKVALVRAFDDAKSKIQSVRDETYYHNLILRYADYSNIKFRSEAIFDVDIDTDPNDAAKSRRTDLIRVLPRCVQVWELKAHPINERDISQTIAYKGYLSLIAQRFPGRCIDFRFTSPFGIDPSGQRMMDILQCQHRYRKITSDGFNYRCKVQFQSLQELAANIRVNILRNTPARHRYQIGRFIDPQFADILSTSISADNATALQYRAA